MYNILLAGAGQLGSRHLQALAKITIPVSVYVVDPTEQSINTAKERCLQIQTALAEKVQYFLSIKDISIEQFDLVIIASNANVRAQLIRDIASRFTVKFMLLEKFLFQNEKDYFEVQQVFLKYNINAWVNCPMRMWPVYQHLSLIFGDEIISVKMQGGNWGLACNSVHYVDCLSFLSKNEEICDVNITQLDSQIYDSKRSGYKEIGGILDIKFNNGSSISLTDIKDSTAPVVLSFQTKNLHAVFFENTGDTFISKADNNGVWEKYVFQMPYQSNLTNLVAEEILTTGQCALPSYEASSALHLSLLKAFLKHFVLVEKENYINCPIT